MCGKPYFLFPDILKDGFSKKIALEFGLSCIIGKDDISFFRKYDLTPGREMKDDLSQKNIRSEKEIQIFWKDGLFKKDRAGTWSFLYYLERWYFFPKNMVFFPWSENERRMTFLKKYTETWYFLFAMFHATPCEKKNQRRSYPTKIHLKVIDIPDRHLRKGSSNSRYLHRDLYRRFHILLSSKKSQEI